jgi:hypothetical protein
MADRKKKKKPAPPAPARTKPEAFIGHESMTMMGDETFADFERRMAEDKDSSGTAPVPVHVPAKKSAKAPPGPPVPSVVEDEEDVPDEDEPEADDADDALPDEYE